MTLTRFRVSSHSLAIETGRWNRRGRGRLPIHERLCTCGKIQTEEHVVVEFPLTLEARNTYRISSIDDLLFGQIGDDDASNTIYRILMIYS